MSDGKVATEQSVVYAVVQSGRAASRVGHKYLDCSTVNKADGRLEGLTQREAGLLGLRECSVCVKRASGGPAVDAICDVFHALSQDELYTHDTTAEEARDIAFRFIEKLKDRGFYIAQRTKKDGASSPS